MRAAAQSAALQVRLHGRRILPEGEGFGLRQAVGDGEVLLRLVAAGGIHRQQEIERGARAALVQQLEEGMLGVVARLAPDHRAGGDVDRAAIEPHGLAVAFHLELLQVGAGSARRRWS